MPKDTAFPIGCYLTSSLGEVARTLAGVTKGVSNEMFLEAFPMGEWCQSRKRLTDEAFEPSPWGKVPSLRGG